MEKVLLVMNTILLVYLIVRIVKLESYLKILELNINDGFVSLNENGYELHKTMLQVKNNTKKTYVKKTKTENNGK